MYINLVYCFANYLTICAIRQRDYIATIRGTTNECCYIICRKKFNKVCILLPY